jgi:hypothetical protein
MYICLPHAIYLKDEEEKEKERERSNRDSDLDAIIFLMLFRKISSFINF